MSYICSNNISVDLLSLTVKLPFPTVFISTFFSGVCFWMILRKGVGFFGFIGIEWVLAERRGANCAGLKVARAVSRMFLGGCFQFMNFLRERGVTPKGERLNRF